MSENDPNRQAAVLLRAVATTQDQLAAFARKLQRRADVARVTREMDSFGHTDEFPTAPKGVVSWYVEAEFRDGTSRCYELDFFHDGRFWVVSAQITRPGRDGPEAVNMFRRRPAVDIAGCVAQLSAAVDELQRAAIREREP